MSEEKIVWRTPESSVDDQGSGVSHAWVLFAFPMVALCGAEIGESRKLANKDRTCGKCVDRVRTRVMFPPETPQGVEAVAEAFADYMLVEVRPVLVEMGTTIGRMKLGIEDATIAAVVGYLREDALSRFSQFPPSDRPTDHSRRLVVEDLVKAIAGGAWRKHVVKEDSER